MIKKIIKGIFLLLLLVLFGNMSIHIPYTCLLLLILTTIWLTHTKRIQLWQTFISVFFIVLMSGFYFWCPSDRPWNKEGYCYSCQDNSTISVSINEVEAHKKVCPNRFLTAQNCCGVEYYTSTSQKPDVFLTIFCRCVSKGGYELEIIHALTYSFYFFIWTLILKLLGFLDKRKSK